MFLSPAKWSIVRARNVKARSGAVGRVYSDLSQTNMLCSILHSHVCEEKGSYHTHKEYTIMEVWNHLLLSVNASDFHSGVKMNPSCLAPHQPFPINPWILSLSLSLSQVNILNVGTSAPRKKSRVKGSLRKIKISGFVFSRAVGFSGLDETVRNEGHCHSQLCPPQSVKNSQEPASCPFPHTHLV